MLLLRALFRSVLDADVTAKIPEVEQAIRSASPAEWRRTMAQLDRGRIIGLCAASLQRRGLIPSCPTEFIATLRRWEVVNSYANNQRLKLYGELVVKLRQAGVEPVLLKSSVLVALLHPELDAHGMTDLDFLIPPEHAETVGRIAREMNYMQMPADEDSDSYLHPEGLLLLDYHFRFRVFERFRTEDLLEDLPSAHPALDTIRTFEPNAILAHLSVHLNEHRRDLGYGPRWLFDIGFVLRHWSNRFDVERLRQLSPTPEAFGQLLRLVAFFPKEIGVPAPLPLRPHIETVEPFTLEEIYRSQRVACWPLWSARGWVKLAACATGLLDPGVRLLPRASDPVLAVADRMRERRALEAVKRQSASTLPASQQPAVNS